MRHKLITAIALCGVLALSLIVHFGAPTEDTILSDATGTRPQAAMELVGTFNVVQIVDGDTVVLDVFGKYESVRLVGIDAPEVNWETESPECYAFEARDRVEELLAGRQATLLRDLSQDDRDTYGRMLGYILLEDGRDLGELLLREGYVREFTFKKPYAKQSVFRAAETEAQAAGKGIFMKDVCSRTMYDPGVRAPMA